MIRSPEIKPGEKLRLALLYVLRYEEVANLDNLKRELLDGGVPQAQTQLIDLILQHGGKVFVHLLFLICFVALLCLQARRAPGLYGDGGFMSKMAKNLKSGLAGVENVIKIFT